MKKCKHKWLKFNWERSIFFGLSCMKATYYVCEKCCEKVLKQLADFSKIIFGVGVLLFAGMMVYGLLYDPVAFIMGYIAFVPTFAAFLWIPVLLG